MRKHGVRNKHPNSLLSSVTELIETGAATHFTKNVMAFKNWYIETYPGEFQNVVAHLALTQLGAYQKPWLLEKHFVGGVESANRR
jgi:hypothetical protein